MGPALTPGPSPTAVSEGSAPGGDSAHWSYEVAGTSFLPGQVGSGEGCEGCEDCEGYGRQEGRQPSGRRLDWRVGWSRLGDAFPRPGWRNGRRTALKMRRGRPREGSNPSPGTIDLLRPL